MFITHELSPLELLAEFLSISHFEDVETHELKDLRHNRDLCPRFEQVVETIMRVYSAFRVSTMDVQGFKDQGCDVLVKCKRDAKDGVVEEKIGFQIKSHREFSDWWGKKGDSLPEKLRLQYLDAIKSLKVEHYFIVLCVDLNTHRDAVRHIASEFMNYSDVTVVSPRKALSFLRLSEADISAIAARLLCEGDALLEEAKDELHNYSEFAKSYIVWSLCEQLEGRSGVIELNITSVPDEYKERVQREFADLTSFELEWHPEYSGYRSISQHLPSLKAICFDARARLGISLDLPPYINTLLDIRPLHFESHRDISAEGEA